MTQKDETKVDTNNDIKGCTIDDTKRRNKKMT